MKTSLRKNPISLKQEAALRKLVSIYNEKSNVSAEIRPNLRKNGRIHAVFVNGENGRVVDIEVETAEIEIGQKTLDLSYVFTADTSAKYELTSFQSPADDVEGVDLNHSINNELLNSFLNNRLGLN